MLSWPVHLQQIIISVPKTENKTTNYHPQPSLHVYGEPINHVTDFRYLGFKVASAASDFKRRKLLALGAFLKFERLWRSSQLPMSTKFNLFYTTCVTILLLRLGILCSITRSGKQNQRLCYRAIYQTKGLCVKNIFNSAHPFENNTPNVNDKR